MEYQDKKLCIIPDCFVETLDSLLNTEAGTVLTTQDERTVVLNEFGAYIVNNCNGMTIKQIIQLIKDNIEGEAPVNEIIEADVIEFINSLVQEKIASYC